LIKLLFFYSQVGILERPGGGVGGSGTFLIFPAAAVVVWALVGARGAFSPGDSRRGTPDPVSRPGGATWGPDSWGKGAFFRGILSLLPGKNGGTPRGENSFSWGKRGADLFFLLLLSSVCPVKTPIHAGGRENWVFPPVGRESHRSGLQNKKKRILPAGGRFLEWYILGNRDGPSNQRKHSTLDQAMGKKSFPESSRAQ